MLLRSLFALLTFPVMACADDLMLAIPTASRQLVVVSSDGWEAPRATVRRFVRVGAKAPWSPVGSALPALVGERGMAWGLGLQRAPREGGGRKREGDRCAPAGVFRITGAFGTLPEDEAGGIRLPYRRLAVGTEAVDDPGSAAYNQIVERGAIVKPDWRRAEQMWKTGGYQLGLTIGFNPRNVRGAGSCIFLHVWEGRRTGTAGCTVLRYPDLRVLAHWLDPAAKPTLVQGPREALGALGLPE